MIEINLNLLKFHSFNFKKDIHNQWAKSKNNPINSKQHLLEKVFYGELKSKILHFKQFENINKLINDIKKRKNNHQLDIEHKNFLFKIIRTCHKNLWIDLGQLFEDKPYEEKCFYSITLNNRSRIICLFEFEKNVIYPLLLDLNHCIYKAKRNYDKNIKVSNPWDFKNIQKEIKKIIIS